MKYSESLVASCDLRVRMRMSPTEVGKGLLVSAYPTCSPVRAYRAFHRPDRDLGTCEPCGPEGGASAIIRCMSLSDAAGRRAARERVDMWLPYVQLYGACPVMGFLAFPMISFSISHSRTSNLRGHAWGIGGVS